ncbi:hypothetical protein CONCODRAFT_69132 [Conidiobolus coronatus NRRL 28638]|uniref:Uncharacterized protein n=1 Tax=Conidiobolus coronatus (strain ATCC 28846 / CBS 209.66 / NRRL 28638) TaxID=796925 RepID=A0A137PBG0_CONC2|nr:hypothetical protein CONCODRAFT_69132 [Conidiobolus coronatus NRRL 28638]|eukprot:KXN72347.1 hypothetical protein CONCODRAFT_69132 [Conidiobolus coronatus NRRL 28638]
MSHILRVKPDPVPQLYPSKFNLLKDNDKLKLILNNSIPFYNKIEVLLPSLNFSEGEEEEFTKELNNLNLTQFKIKINNFSEFINFIKDGDTLQLIKSSDLLITTTNQTLLIIIPTYLKQSFNLNFKPLTQEYSQLELSLTELKTTNNLIDKLSYFLNFIQYESLEFILSLSNGSNIEAFGQSCEIIEEINSNWSTTCSAENIQIPTNLPKDNDEHFYHDLVEFYDYWGNLSCNIDRLHDKVPLDPYLSEFTFPENCQALKLKKYTLSGYIPSSYFIQLLALIQSKALNNPYLVINLWNGNNSSFLFNNTRYLDSTTMSLVLNGEVEGDSWLLRVISSINNK